MSAVLICIVLHIVIWNGCMNLFMLILETDGLHIEILSYL